MLTKIWTVGDNKGRVDTIVINNKSKIIFLNNSTFYAEVTKQNTICVHVHIILFAVLVYLRRSSQSVNPRDISFSENKDPKIKPEVVAGRIFTNCQNCQKW